MSAMSTPTPSTFVPPDRASSIPEETYPSARVVFDFAPTSPYELAVSGEAFTYFHKFLLTHDAAYPKMALWSK